MVSFIFGLSVLALQASCFPVVLKSDLQVRRPESGGGIKVDFNVSHEVGTGLRKRSFSSKLSNKKTYYTTALKFGSRKKKIEVQIDTGSSDLWVIDSRAVCAEEAYGNFCLKYGTFDPSKSTSAQSLDIPFEIVYGDETYALGEYITDVVSMGDITLSNLTFGVGTNVTAVPGILGLGFRANEASFEVDNNYTYPNFGDALVAQGVIDKNYFSLYLDGPKSKSGSLLFGGIDSTKYVGSLAELDIAAPSEFFVNATSFNVGGNQFKDELPLLLDSGTTDCYLPTKWVDAIADTLTNAEYDSDTGLYVVDCKVPKENVTFTFDGVTIDVPISSFISKAEDLNGKRISGCNLNIEYSSSRAFDENNPAILGDLFLKYAYVVYDLTDRKISIGQSKY